MPDTTPRRPPLTRPAVLEAAVALADQQGLDAVSMRALATRLSVVPMALYKHVSDKDDLVAGMLDVVVASYREPERGISGAAAARERIVSARLALAQHPWLRPAIERASQRTPAVLAHLDAIAGDFAADGYSYDLIHHAMHALGQRVWGFNPEAFADAAPSGPPDPELIAQFAQAYPHIVAVAMDSAARNPAGACDEDGEFEFTLDLLLDSVAGLHKTGWMSAPLP